MNMTSTRVLVVEDSPTVRDKLARCSRPIRELELVGEARRRPRGDRAMRGAAPRRRHHGHDAAGDERACRHRIHHGALSHAHPGGVVVVQPRRSVQDLRRAGRRRRRRPRKAQRRGARRRMGSALPVGAENRFAHPRHHPPARAAAEPAIRHAGAPPPSPAAADAAGPAGRAIGASTGGPSAVVEVIRALPPTFRCRSSWSLHINQLFGHCLRRLARRPERRAAPPLPATASR